jgi:hypothetical protein
MWVVRQVVDSAFNFIMLTLAVSYLYELVVVIDLLSSALMLLLMILITGLLVV